MGCVQKTLGIREEKSIGVYVHIPFCISKCPYCDFNSEAIRRVPEKRYLDALRRELSSVAGRESLNGAPLDSIYLGGGTPSLLSPDIVSILLASIKETFTPAPGCEVTLEANPESVSPEKLSGYRDAGVNRLSIGVQSFNDEELKSLGRPHRAQKAEAAFTWAREAGFDNIGIDLICGVPGQDMAGLKGSISKAVGLKPEHVSLYSLTIEENTPYHSLYRSGMTPEWASALPSEEEEASMHDEAVRLLNEAGYIRYEISNFCLPGKESRHNRRYWDSVGYIGIGAGAHSYLSCKGWGKRWWNTRDYTSYMESVEARGRAVEGSEELSRKEAVLEAVILGFRKINEGISGEDFKTRFGKYPFEELPELIELEKEGLVVRKAEDILLTPEGLKFANSVFLRLA